MHKKIQEHSMRIIIIAFVVIIVVGVVAYISTRDTTPARPSTRVFTNADRMIVLTQRSNIPDIEPTLTEADRLKILSQPTKTTTTKTKTVSGSKIKK